MIQALHPVPTRRSSDLARQDCRPQIASLITINGPRADGSNVSRPFSASRLGNVRERPGILHNFTNSRRVKNSRTDRKSTRLNSSHGYKSDAVFGLKKNI